MTPIHRDDDSQDRRTTNHFFIALVRGLSMGLSSGIELAARTCKEAANEAERCGNLFWAAVARDLACTMESRLLHSDGSKLVEMEKLMLDAHRYRWLRDKSTAGADAIYIATDDPRQSLRPRDVDAFIDERVARMKD